MDLFDDLAYWGNYIDRLAGWVGMAVSPSKGGRFGPSVQMKIPDESGLTRAQVTKHLQKYGVRVFTHLHDSRGMYFSVRKRQEGWARKLYNEETGVLWSPGKSWKEQQPHRKSTLADWWQEFWR